MRPSAPKELLKSARTDTFLVSTPVNIRYLTGLDMSSGLLLATKRKWILFTDGRYLEMARAKCRKGMAVADIDDIEKVMRRVPVCGIEAEEVTLGRKRRWKRHFKNTKFVQRTEVVEEFRRSKEPDELRKFRKAQAITTKIMQKVPRALKRGVTERDLAWKIRLWAHELGAEDVSFDPIVGFGSNTSLPHHHPTDRKLAIRDIVQIDCGAKYQGYCADQSAVFFVGKPKKRWLEVYGAVEEAKEEAKKWAKDGVTTHEISRVADEVLAKYGLADLMPHALGHGVGLDIHEGVGLSDRNDPVDLLKNEIITIEPGVYFEGDFGIRLEEEVVVR